MAKTHYQTLEVKPTASQEEIKQSYRRLAKVLHPDRNEDSSHEAIAHLNVAYETLSDPHSRRAYDQQQHYTPTATTNATQRNAEAADIYRKARATGPNSDDQIKTWINRAYTPTMRLITQIIKPLKEQIRDLSADPFDDELMGAFMTYLEGCRSDLEKAQRLSKSVPNPPTLSNIAANLYYCLNQLSDGLQELDYFTVNYDETSLHAGYEMFRIAQGLKREAQAAVRELPK